MVFLETQWDSEKCSQKERTVPMWTEKNILAKRCVPHTKMIENKRRIKEWFLKSLQREYIEMYARINKTITYHTIHWIS